MRCFSGATRRLALALGLLVGLFGAQARACDLALVLAIDVSSSVSVREYDVQRAAHAAAFRDPVIQDAILAVGGVRVVLVHWSGNLHQQARTLWTFLESREAIEAYAALLGSIQRRFDTLGTAMGAALQHLEGAWIGETRDCRRRVIDLVADGVLNTGLPIAAPRARLLADGVTINALAIRGADPDPAPFLAREVIGGPGAFMIEAEGFDDYAEAFRIKLLREILGGPVASDAR